MEGSPAPRTPYRDGQPLAEIIPPDRRRAKAIALVGSSMVAGAALWALGGWAVEALQHAEPTATVVSETQGYAGGRIPRSLLHGPGGSTVSMPPAERSIVHVWLQGCSDCMPAFNSIAEISRDGSLSLGVPIVNVAYGEADETWAGRYGVATNLVFDQGGANVVKPLGIGTFTTLVVDPDGTVIHRDRPDRAGYVARVRAAVRSRSLVTPPPHVPTPYNEVPPASQDGIALDADAVQRVVASHRAAVKRTCWDRRDRAGAPARAKVTVMLTVDTDGRVSNATSIGDDAATARCIEEQARTWIFPRPQGQMSLSIPFEMVQE